MKKKIIFYGNTLRAFRTTLIWYLYELCQENECCLVINDIDEQTNLFLDNKAYFPGLIKIIVRNCDLSFEKNIIIHNRELNKFAKELIYNFDANVVICSSDWHSLFEMYLLRFAKRKNLVRITLQDTLGDDVATIKKYYHLLNKNKYNGSNLLLPLSNFLIKSKSIIKHITVYWIFPLLNLELPFYGLSSYILLYGNSGIRDTNLHIIFKENYINFINSGVPDNKLRINDHPIKRINRNIADDYFKKIYPTGLFDNKEQTIIILLGNIDIGFRMDNFNLIDERRKRDERIRLIETIANILPNYNIIIKAHPNCIHIDDYKFENNDRITFINKNECVESIIFYSRIVIDLPIAYSTATYFASLLYPEKIVLAIDTLNEYCGDYFKHYSGIEYIDTFEKFVDCLTEISNNTYKIPYQSITNNNLSINVILNQLIINNDVMI